MFRRSHRLVRTIAVAVALLGMAGCGRSHETRMVDPRTGVVALCESGRFNLFTTAAAVAPMQACIDELSYYGFRDEQQLRAAARPAPRDLSAPPRARAPLPERPMPVARLPAATPPDEIGPPDPGPVDTGPFGKSPLSPGY